MLPAGLRSFFQQTISNYFLGTEFSDSSNGTPSKILTIDSGVTEALADEGHGCAAELCSNAATQGAWLSGAETNQFTSSTGLYLCLCLLWMLWLLLSWMLKLGCMEEIWLKLGEFLAFGRNWAQSSLKI